MSYEAHIYTLRLKNSVSYKKISNYGMTLYRIKLFPRLTTPTFFVQISTVLEIYKELLLL